VRLHPDIIRMHIQDTTAAACRRRRHRFGIGSIIGAVLVASSLLYFALRAAS
jgi:hypothetical protein